MRRACPSSRDAGDARVDAPRRAGAGHGLELRLDHVVALRPVWTLDVECDPRLGHDQLQMSPGHVVSYVPISSTAPARSPPGQGRPERSNGRRRAGLVERRHRRTEPWDTGLLPERLAHACPTASEYPRRCGARRRRGRPSSAPLRSSQAVLAELGEHVVEEGHRRCRRRPGRCLQHQLDQDGGLPGGVAPPARHGVRWKYATDYLVMAVRP